MKRYPKFRLRREFAHLEAQVDPDFSGKAWWQFYNAVVNGGPSTKSYLDQFRLAARIARLHARRDRWNATRRWRTHHRILQEIAPLFRGQYFSYVAGGMVRVADPATGEFRSALIGGAACLNRRDAGKLMEELETIHEMMEPRVPLHRIDRERARGEAEAAVPRYRERAGFEALLAPTPRPDKQTSIAPFQFPASEDGPVQGHSDPQDQRDETASASAARQAS